jgi:hypothetical protein
MYTMLGVNALFAIAYGNVGSSIYYALGLVAGLTPVVFVITGIFFTSERLELPQPTSRPAKRNGSYSDEHLARLASGARRWLDRTVAPAAAIALLSLPGCESIRISGRTLALDDKQKRHAAGPVASDA